MPDTTKEFVVYSITASSLRDLLESVCGYTVYGDLTDDDLERIAKLAPAFDTGDFEQALEDGAREVLGDRVREED